MRRISRLAGALSVRVLLPIVPEGAQNPAQSDEGLYETGPLVTKIYAPLEEVLNLQSLSMRTFGGSDHVAFLRAGVPAYFCVQSPAHYREAHHYQADTFDKAIPEEINEGAALLAAWAWNVSELTQALPHHALQARPQN